MGSSSFFNTPGGNDGNLLSTSDDSARQTQNAEEVGLIYLDENPHFNLPNDQAMEPPEKRARASAGKTNAISASIPTYGSQFFSTENRSNNPIEAVIVEPPTKKKRTDSSDIVDLTDEPEADPSRKKKRTDCPVILDLTDEPEVEPPRKKKRTSSPNVENLDSEKQTSKSLKIIKENLQQGILNNDVVRNYEKCFSERENPEIIKFFKELKVKVLHS